MFNIKKPRVMKKSEKNLAVIENFILHLTHCSDEKDPLFTEPQTYTPEELYRVGYDYIEEDHVDGKENSEDYDDYELFLFSNLFMTYFEDSNKIPYDIIFKFIQKEFSKFYNSDSNNSTIGLYSCISNYLVNNEERITHTLVGLDE